METETGSTLADVPDAMDRQVAIFAFLRRFRADRPELEKIDYELSRLADSLHRKADAMAESCLEMIHQARSHIYAVNGFPDVLSLQHALVHATRRGVRVRAITGHLTPTHDGTPLPGPGRWHATF
jgi:phosphatidylserine/phosphatidylglycerophosphate/cardiolipin synthase-like enzyme